MRAPLFPSWLERAVIAEVLGETVAARAAEGFLPKHLLAPYAGHIAQMSARFTDKEQAPFTRYLDNPIAHGAYAIYYSFFTAAKVAALITQTLSRGILTTDIFRITELGCGPGGGLMGAALALPSRISAFTGVDYSPEAVSLATRILGATGVPFTPLVADLQDTLPDLAAPQDIVIIANTLNELWRGEDNAIEKRADFITKAGTQYLAPRGIIIIIEPALADTSRALSAVRERLLANGGWCIHYPCTHHQPCPALSSSDEWCHDTISWEAPPIVWQLDEIVGFNKHRLKFSALVLSRTSPCDLAGCWYVFNEPRTSKGMVELTACGASGLVRMMLSRRHYSVRNRAFKKLRKGDHFSLVSQQSPHTTYRLEKEDVVTLG